MSLTDLKVRNVKAKNKAYKLSDERGLYLLVTPKGSKCWRFKYRFGGKEKVLAIGMYPDISLFEAREKHNEARKQLANEIDPSTFKQISKRSDRLATENSFEAIAREWFSKYAPGWEKSHSVKILSRLEKNVFPWIGKIAIAEVEPPQLLSVLRRIEDRGALDTAHRIHQYCGKIFRYAIAIGKCTRDPSADLRGAIPPARVKHRAAILEPNKLVELIKVMEGYEGYFVTKCALLLAPLLFVRPGELRKAEWSEIDLVNAVWSIPAEKMKMRQPHLVPLPQQAIQILRELYPLTGSGKYLFPGVRTKERPMSDNTINAALRRLGYGSSELTAHGFRASARTILDEVLGFRPDVIEHQLAHAVKDPLGRAYNRTTHLQVRREMMQRWADYLDELKLNNGKENGKVLILQDGLWRKKVM
jgi:integrase